MRRVERLRRVFETLGQPARGSFHRAVPLKHQKSPLSGIGSINTGGRYNPKGAFQVLYFANDADTVIREVRNVQYDAGGVPITVPTAPYILLTVEYNVSVAVDLTDSAIQSQLKITNDDITGEWVLELLNGKNPLTHDLGRAARAAGIEALKVPSARNPGHLNVAVIEDQLLTTSYVRIYQPDGFDPATPIETRGLKASRH